MSTKTEEVLENVDKSLTSISYRSERILSGVNRMHGQLISMDRKLDKAIAKLDGVLTNEEVEELFNRKPPAILRRTMDKLIALVTRK